MNCDQELKILPWHKANWDFLWGLKQQARLPHAILLAGAPGLGKHYFAELFASALLCSSTTSAPCGQCHSCQLVRAGSHPDLYRLAPEGGNTIKVEQAREANDFMQKTSSEHGAKVVIISPAESMNMAAENALLKTLEEPARETCVLLVSGQNLKLPATILSRCQKLFFARPLTEVALAWLQEQLISANLENLKLLLRMAEGAPLKVLTWQANDMLTLRQTVYQGLIDLSHSEACPITLAAAWQESPLHLLLELLWAWTRDLLWSQLSHGKAPLINQDYTDFFARSLLTPRVLMDFLNQLHKRFAEISHLQNLNRSLLLEGLLIHWTEYHVSR